MVGGGSGGRSAGVWAGRGIFTGTGRVQEQGIAGVLFPASCMIASLSKLMYFYIKCIKYVLMRENLIGNIIFVKILSQHSKM